MDYLLGGTSGPRRVKFPAVNAWVNDEGINLTAEIPGVDPESINITVSGDEVSLSGTRNLEDLPEDIKFHRRERGFGEFVRTLNLPFEVDADAVEAKFHNGVLNIKMPRLPEEKPRKIEVRSG
jgi:HSP20 family protein